MAYPAAADAARAPASGPGCLSYVASTECRFSATSTPSTPVQVTVPSGLTKATVILAGGRGANGDLGARGGGGGLVIAEISLVPGHQLQIWSASGGNSTTPGQGYGNGGSSSSQKVGNDAGAGGGASAVVDATTNTVVAVAGGGGGAGGSWNDTNVGGDGGSAGAPAGTGVTGATIPVNPSGGQKEGGTPGTGGCANGQATDLCTTKHRHHGSNGGNGAAPAVFEGGGGGGGGYLGGDGGGAAQGVYVLTPPAGGGGGGGGQSYVNPGAVIPGGVVLAEGTVDTYSGYVAFQLTGSATRLDCTSGGNTGTYTVPSGTTSVLAVAGGAQGGVSDGTGPAPAGFGALAVGTLAVQPLEHLSLTAGCRGYGRNSSPGAGPSGGGGHGQDFVASTGYDGGGGGGGSSVNDAEGPMIQAGGGGGGGGSATPSLTTKGGMGGNAGRGWGAAGAGNGFPACISGTISLTSTCPGEVKPGTGGASQQPGGHGDQGSDGATGIQTGGGGGGGGGAVGGTGGDGGGFSINPFAEKTKGGGGGGAGSSAYRSTAVTQPSIGTSGKTGDGFVLLLAQTQYGAYENTGIASETVRSGPGFDGAGDWYDAGNLKAANLGPGQTFSVGLSSLVFPNVPTGMPDNILAHGQTVPVTAAGSFFTVVGASTFGTTGGTATITYSDGSTSTFTLTLGDWVDATPAPGTTLVRQVSVIGPHVNQASIWAQTVPLTTGKRAVSLTLPNVSDHVGAYVPALHVFAYGSGGYDNNGIYTPGDPSTGFDGWYNFYDPASLAAAGLGPGSGFSVGPVNLTFPNVAPGAPDNYLARGQTLPIAGSGPFLTVVGAGSFGNGKGTATIGYSDGTSSTFTLTLADWAAKTALPGTTAVATNLKVQGNSGYAAAVWAQTVTLTPGKRAVSLTLPDISSTVSLNLNAMHVFAYGVGGYDNAGIGPLPKSSGVSPLGFDGVGNTYSAAGLAAAGFGPGQKFTVGSVSLTFPNTVPGEPDNMLAEGQTLPITGTGASLVLVGASSYGPTRGLASVTYADGSSSSFVLRSPDWAATTSPPNGVTLVGRVPGIGGNASVALWAQTLALPAGKRAVSITLPHQAFGVGQGTPTMHFFAYGVG